MMDKWVTTLNQGLILRRREISKTVFVGQEKCADENVKQIECHLQNNEFQTTSSTPPPTTTSATRAA